MIRENNNYVYYIAGVSIFLAYFAYLNFQIYKNTEEIDNMYYQVEELKENVKDLQDEMDDKSVTHTDTDFSSELEGNYQQQIQLLEEQIELDKKRSLQQTVFYGLIKDSQYEDYITSTTYTNPRNRNLDKVAVSITGTDNIINFLLHINSESHFAYIESQPNY